MPGTANATPLPVVAPQEESEQPHSSCPFSLQRLHFVYSSVHLRQETFVGERAFWAMSILKQFEREANTV